MKNITIFEVKNVVDRSLKRNREHGIYEKTIQSGCYFTKERIAEFCDNVGEHISERNLEYSEFTAMYWVWKNYKADYIGWTHYRRKFCLNDSQIDKLLDSGIEVILPQMLYVRGLEMQFKCFHPYRFWNEMLDAIKELYPDEYESVLEICSHKYFFPVCLGIYRYEIFCKCCEWVFPVLNKVYEKINDEVNDRHQKRYIAFLGERLLSIYWMLHLKEYRVKCIKIEILPSLEKEEDFKKEIDEKKIVYDLINRGQITKAVGEMDKKILSMSLEKIVRKVIRVLEYENVRLGSTMIDKGADIEKCIYLYKLFIAVKEKKGNIITFILEEAEKLGVSDYFCVALIRQEFGDFINIWEQLCIEWRNYGNITKAIPYALEILRYDSHNKVANIVLEEILKENVV